jgi:hypothetical protein
VCPSLGHSLFSCVVGVEENIGFLKFQRNRLDQSRDIMRYVGKSPLGGALDREMYEMIMMSVMTAQEGCGDDVEHGCLRDSKKIQKLTCKM